MKRFEIKKRTVVSFDKSAEIPSELTENVGGGALTRPRYKCSDVYCLTEDGVSCDTCGCPSQVNTCQNTCDQFSCAPCYTGPSGCDVGCGSVPVRRCNSDICYTDLC